MKKRTIIMMAICLGVFLFSFRHSPAESCDAQPVRIEKHEIDSAELGETLHFSVYIPPCMDERVVGGYPVLYLFHGQDMSMDVWEEIGLSAALRAGLTERSLPLFYVVVPEEKNYLEPLSLSYFGDMVITELIPWMDSHYHTVEDRSGRAVGGISRGALWAEKLAFMYPELFSSLGLHSMPGLPFGDMDLFYLVKDQSPEEKIRVRFDSGTLDGFRTEAQRAFSQLDTLSYPVEFYSSPGEHDTDYWRSQIRKSLEWYAVPWK